MAAAVLQEEENMDRGGRRKRKERTDVTAKEIPWAVGDGDLETTAAKEAIATKRKRSEAATVEAYIPSRWREEPAAKEDVNRGRSRGRPRPEGGKGDGERPQQQRLWVKGGTGREEKIDGEGWFRRRYRTKGGEGEGRDRWSRKEQGAALKLNGGEAGVSQLRRRRRADGGENRREEGRRSGVDAGGRRPWREERWEVVGFKEPATAAERDGERGERRQQRRKREIGTG